MKKIIFLLVTFFYSFAFAKPGIVVSILPEKTFVQKIAKNLVEVTVMVEPGASPHSYEPKATQMIALSKADIYFSIGVGFEDVWLDRFKSQNSNLKVIDMSSGISKLPMSAHHHEHHNELDPHTWTSPSNVVIMAHTIFKALSELDPHNEQFYKSNLEEFIKEIKETDTQIKNALKDLEPKSKFMVFHPSWGYFAHEYDLAQIAVEVEGKKPKPKELITIIEEARSEHVKAIFTQPEFSDKSAQVIARELHIPVKKISPLSEQWSKNLIFMAKSIANK